MIPSKKPDDEVGTGEKQDGFSQTPAQKAALAQGGEEAGRPEPKSPEDWAARGASGGEPGRPPVALGGNSQGQGDRMPAGGASGANAPATNPKTRPGERHEA